jgi:hypothetical protein
VLVLIVITEPIFRAVDICAETEVVDLAFVILIEILSNDEIENLVGGGKQTKVLKNSLKLLGSGVARLSAIEVLEAGLQEHSG